MTYPDLEHTFSLSSQWWISLGPIPHYVLRDFYSLLEAHNGFTPLTTSSLSSLLSSNNTELNH